MTLRYDFYREDGGSGGAGGAPPSSSGKVSIVVPHVERLQEDDHTILRELVQRFQVGEQHR